MNYTPEFSAKPAAAPEAQTRTKELAACYARLFLGSDDGKRVLADLRTKFGVDRLCFRVTQGAAHSVYDPIAAAITDGERHVLKEIEVAIETGAPMQVLKTTRSKKKP